MKTKQKRKIGWENKPAGLLISAIIFSLIHRALGEQWNNFSNNIEQQQIIHDLKPLQWNVEAEGSFSPF